MRLSHIPTVLKRGVALHELARADGALRHHIVFGLLAHSHAVRARTPERSITEALRRADVDHVSDPRDCLDFLCVADLAAWASMRFPQEFHGETAPGRVSVTYMGPLNDPAPPEVALAIPIGRLLTGLLRRLSSHDPTLRSIGDYFQSSGLFGVGQGAPREFEVAEMPAELQRSVY